MNTELERTMIRFLLGEMPAEERAGFEDHYTKDTDLLYRLVELENDLIDLYAMGAVTPSERKRLERTFLADPERRKRLSFARAMISYPGGKTPGIPRVAGRSLIRRLYSSNGLLPVAAVLLLAALIGIWWLLAANHQLGTQLDVLSKQQADSQKTTASLQQQIEALTRELNSRSRSNGQIEEKNSSDRTLVSFVLKADSLRSGGVTPKLIIPSTATSVAFHLVFPADAFPDYNVFLETANGSAVWKKANALAVPAAGGGKEIVIRVSSILLKTGDYVARITGKSGRGTEDVAGYSFSVIHR